ncbi:MAG: hypothetical protein AB1752_13030 [Candidatus Zixiibacteriota bacterium]
MTTTPPEAGNAPVVAGPDDPARVLLSWRSHPVRQGGRRLAIVLGALVVFPVGLGLLYGPFYSLLALVILGGSLLTYFLPTDYIFYSGGIESRFIGVNRRFTWDQFRSYYPDRHGVLLSPFPKPSRLENFRGVYLRFDGRLSEVMAIVADKVRRREDSQ